MDDLRHTCVLGLYIFGLTLGLLHSLRSRDRNLALEMSNEAQKTVFNNFNGSRTSKTI